MTLAVSSPSFVCRLPSCVWMFLISQDKEKGEVEMFERLTAAFSLFCFSLKLFLISCWCVRGLPDVWESSVENLKAVMENCGWKQAAVVISLCQWWVMKNYDNKDVMKFQWVSEKCLRLEALSSNSSSGKILTRFLPLSCNYKQREEIIVRRTRRKEKVWMSTFCPKHLIWTLWDAAQILGRSGICSWLMKGFLQLINTKLMTDDKSNY